ncbi:forespore capture DNA-binding protein RefZ [Bacillus tuaregi]|uniref:forespore capture DNA-binding protein RefZ n=1 Tax=Bacillus tuaregi TaxID=1816695 RepID=UPI0028FCA3A2|nr:forespore capture DNA-binding protein RefZ [Bacillus tuaregi]
MMKKNSKEEIIQAAIFLFNTKGFQGTTVRDIAGKAKVNVANISYYFQNKNGLLEYCFTDYYENYLSEFEKGMSVLESDAYVCMQKVIENILHFQSENLHLTRFILRELSLDTQVVREMMSTYLTKERYLFSKILEHGMSRKEFKKVDIHFFIIQLKGLLSMPFLNSHYISEVLHILPHESYFADKYYLEVKKWLEGILIPSQVKRNYHVAPPTVNHVPIRRTNKVHAGGAGLRYILERH